MASQKVNKTTCFAHGFAIPPRQDQKGIKCNFEFRSKSNKRKAKRKHKPPPPSHYAQPKQGKKSERKNIARSRQYKAKPLLSFSSLALGQTHPSHNQKLKTPQEQEESKNKGRLNKEEGGGRKKGGQASHPTFNLITKIKSIPCKFAILRQVCLNQIINPILMQA